jgi:hypothetical protein
MRSQKRPAILALADGTVFHGLSFGAPVERCGEVVFNTSMTGYQEVLTDPSYRGQIVAMTYPLIGNYGVNSADAESRSVWLEGFVVKELSRVVSNWRSEMSVEAYLPKHGVPGSEGGVSDGMEFDVYRQGEALVDPDTGMTLGAETEKIGRIKVTGVKDKFSIAAVVSGADMQRGDLVKSE